MNEAIPVADFFTSSKDNSFKVEVSVSPALTTTLQSNLLIARQSPLLYKSCEGGDPVASREYANPGTPAGLLARAADGRPGARAAHRSAADSGAAVPWRPGAAGDR